MNDLCRKYGVVAVKEDSASAERIGNSACIIGNNRHTEEHCLSKRNAEALVLAHTDKSRGCAVICKYLAELYVSRKDNVIAESESACVSHEPLVVILHSQIRADKNEPCIGNKLLVAEECADNVFLFLIGCYSADKNKILSAVSEYPHYILIGSLLVVLEADKYRSYVNGTLIPHFQKFRLIVGGVRHNVLYLVPEILNALVAVFRKSGSRRAVRPEELGRCDVVVYHHAAAVVIAYLECEVCAR